MAPGNETWSESELTRSQRRANPAEQLLQIDTYMYSFLGTYRGWKIIFLDASPTKTINNYIH